MTNEDLEFYKELWPALREGDWKLTGADHFGAVHRRCYFTIEVDGLKVDYNIGHLVGPTYSRYFVDIEGVLYPDSGASINIDADPKSIDYRALASGAESFVRANILRRAAGIRKAHQEWVDSLG